MNRPLILRLTLFVVLFLALTSYFGPGIVSSRLLYPFYFFIYGNIGKILLFSFLSFILLTGKKLLTLTPKVFDKSSVIFMSIALMLTVTFPSLKTELLKYDSFHENVLLSTTAHLIVILIPIFIFLSLFGVSFTRKVLHRFKKEAIICLITGIILYFAIFGIWGLWPYLSGLVLYIVNMLFNITHQNVVVFPPHTLFVEKFAVTIDEACSGLESLLLFSGLSFLILYMDRKRLAMRRFLVFYILGLIGTFIVNIVRVYAIICAGLIFSPQTAATLFHTYLGMILFLGYFVIFLKFNYHKILKKV